MFYSITIFFDVKTELVFGTPRLDNFSTVCCCSFLLLLFASDSAQYLVYLIKNKKKQQIADRHTQATFACNTVITTRPLPHRLDFVRTQTLKMILRDKKGLDNGQKNYR